ncbi:MAG: ATP-grasp domain-containing protein [Hyphomicrobiaceae bacterium]
MSRPINILFEAAGRRVSLVKAFRRALDETGLAGKTIAVNSDRRAAALYVADVAELAPRVSAPNYIEALLGLCRKHEASLLVPLIDPALPRLAAHHADFAALGTRLIVSSPETIAIGANKVATGNFFRTNGFRTPHVLSKGEIEALRSGDFPVFAKPAEGSSSIGADAVRDAEELNVRRAADPSLVVMELVRGEEYTIDVYVDFQGVPRCAVPRLRLETRAGEISKGLTVRDETLIALSLDVVRKLPGAIGCITLQAFKVADGGFVFIEINPRFGGGYPLSRHAGADYPRWMIEEAAGRVPDFDLGRAFRANLGMLRYDDEIIVDGGLIR